MDRVKAAIFSSLGDHILGARVLDLFAGTGGLGIEALSRGAASALFVELNRQAARAIERNLAIVQLQAKVRVEDVFEFARHTDVQFDIVFADPPYERTSAGESFTDLLLSNSAIPRLVAAGGVFVLEKRPGETMPAHSRWELLRKRRYGTTQVLFLTHAR